ncbi:DUF1269 domain-containing protein [Nocardioides marmotae]|uniref:DUF1269 domain-containing protein n=1 Tax=Nocardioides marmotae TaxID=2663857 RepID=A0A6I3J9F5_9ACTN|nr:DUF1269 domain-containing protein [Nocardioides marmotae]MCR6030756.1 DUF1269 domain-containing protein [Gordonia jinghuaiqii]MBC9733979.1 DUF1269 domain-containing protein [Nocardioides marmotae]MTB85082.1 DUF1269 domain-containing protein [Nocardioides marmotae]MTB94390.1 DUF1269 domain-containing protein [Nocardioides marmotae]QKE01584.1 DUF1269 domain-containing protein [Nocardioides marmotae]
MATLTVWRFDDPDGAKRAEHALAELEKKELIQVVDAATVSWPEGKKKPRTRQSTNMVAAGTLGGMFWGTLFGLIFFVPLLGLVVGAASGALAGSLTDVGIDDDFIDSVRQKVTPGTSALFVLTNSAVVDRVHTELRERGIRGELLETNLSHEQEARLRAALEEDNEDERAAHLEAAQAAKA